MTMRIHSLYQESVDTHNCHRFDDCLDVFPTNSDLLAIGVHDSFPLSHPKYVTGILIPTALALSSSAKIMSSSLINHIL